VGRERHVRPRFPCAPRALVSLGLLLAACGQSQGAATRGATGDPGSGGSSGGAGKPSATGGSATGGANATGGSGGATGGTSATGGSGAASGASANGGASASGGANASGGASGSSAGAGDDCEEVQQPVTGSSFEGDLSLATPADVEVARAYSSISGSLYVTALTELDLPNLTHVGGDVYIEKSALVSLSLSNLVTIEGALWLYLNYELVSADFRTLERAGARVFIHRNIKLASLQIQALAEVGTADFSDVSGNSALPDCFVTGTALESVLSSSSLDCTCSVVCGLVEASC
jgi:hypothetical protein